MTLNLSALVLAVLGALVYVFVSNSKAATMGLVAFGVGLFWFVSKLAAGGMTLR